MHATISADIVKSTSLGQEDTLFLQKRLREFVSQVDAISDGSWGRVVRGDSVEIVVADERRALRIALLLRYWVKSIEVDRASERFLKDGIRVAIGMGGLRINNEEDGVIDGVAIYASGRALADMKRDSFVIVCEAKYCREWLSTMAMLLDALICGTTKAQSVVMYHKLKGISVVQICEKVHRTEQAVYSLLRNAGCRAIEQALAMFEKGDLWR